MTPDRDLHDLHSITDRLWRAAGGCVCGALLVYVALALLIL